MNVVRLGAVEYLNARPLVRGLAGSPRFTIRFDVPSTCASLLHAGAIDVGLIPSIEYLRGPVPYAIVPRIAIASHGRVASVAIYTTRAMADVRTLALDTSSRSSVALARVLCARAFQIAPAWQPHPPDLEGMLAVADAALIIGDNALFLDGGDVIVKGRRVTVQKIDLGEVWTETTGLPFVYAFWAGRPDVLDGAAIEALLAAKHEGIGSLEAVARAYFPDAPDRQAVGARYLRDNIRYDLGDSERAGLEAFYRYAAEAGVVDRADSLRFFQSTVQPAGRVLSDPA
jgi:chorismate dehydratase